MCYVVQSGANLGSEARKKYMVREKSSLDKDLAGGV